MHGSPKLGITDKEPYQVDVKQRKGFFALMAIAYSTTDNPVPSSQILRRCRDYPGYGVGSKRLTVEAGGSFVSQEMMI
ncbi:hypothetical protein B9S53_18855 [Arthrospira sp. O9.13F]|nr:hypothetical protein B9S53_18855 [Arthrospira sp. O9.13F]